MKTLVSGPYIQMHPGPKKPAHQFEGLGHSPVIAPNAAGTHFELTADHRGALGPGTPIAYLGQQVGKVKNVQLENNGQQFRIGVFIDAPYDRLVHNSSRFWNAGALQISRGDEGLEAKLNSAKALLVGLIAFETPTSVQPLIHLVARGTVRQTNELISGSTLKESLGHFEASLATLENILQSVDESKIAPIVDGLRQTANAVRLAADSASTVLGTTVGLGTGTLPAALDEMQGRRDPYGSLPTIWNVIRKRC